MIIKYTATVKLEKRKDKDGKLILDKTPVIIDLAYNSNRTKINVGVRVDATTFVGKKGDLVCKWDDDTKQAKVNTVHYKGKTAKQINTAINDLLVLIADTFKRFEVMEKIPSITEFLSALKPNSKVGLEDTPEIIIDTPFYTAFDLYVEQGKSKWQKTTLLKHYTAKKHLLAYNKNLTFEDLNNTDNIDAFKMHLVKMGLRNVSNEKYLKVLKWFLKWAVAKSHTVHTKFLSYSPSQDDIKKDIIFLEQKDFLHLYNLEIKQPHLVRVRDVFCFSCVTGLRFSDVANLKRSNVKDDKIHITTIKTNDNLKIKLNKYSRAILEKYKDLEFNALPVISNQKTNEYLKQVCELAGFNEPIQLNYMVGNVKKSETYPKYELMSFHAGRRTFVCLGLFLGMDTKTIMSFTGHKSHEAMKPYTKIVEQLKDTEMKKFDF